jgi:tetratricopeptide (TPR) repeat protein
MTVAPAPLPQIATLLAGLEITPNEPWLLQALVQRCEADAAWLELHGALSHSLPQLEPGTELQAMGLYYLGKACVELDRHDEALPHLEESILGQPDFGYTHQLLGRCFRKAGSSEQALQAFGRVTELLPQFPWGWLDLGELLLEQGRPAEAVQALLKASAAARASAEATPPEIPTALDRALDAHLHQRKRQLAEALFPGAHPLSPLQDLQLSLALLADLEANPPTP